jgi:hypothetical protein
VIVHCGSGFCFGAAGCGNDRFGWFCSEAWAAAGVFPMFFELLSGTFTLQQRRCCVGSMASRCFICFRGPTVFSLDFICYRVFISLVLNVPPLFGTCVLVFN